MRIRGVSRRIEQARDSRFDETRHPPSLEARQCCQNGQLCKAVPRMKNRVIPASVFSVAISGFQAKHLASRRARVYNSVSQDAKIDLIRIYFHWIQLARDYLTLANKLL